jgi:electron transport complex protein RnfA
MVLASLFTYAINTWVLATLEIEFMQTIVFIFVIASLVQMLEMILKKISPSLYASLGVYLPLITTNCAILGVALLNVESGYNFVESMVGSLGAGIGFMLAMVIFTGVRSRVEQANPPKSWKGLPITLAAAALVALSFTGFGGIIESIFGAI